MVEPATQTPLGRKNGRSRWRTAAGLHLLTTSIYSRFHQPPITTELISFQLIMYYPQRDRPWINNRILNTYLCKQLVMQATEMDNPPIIWLMRSWKTKPLWKLIENTTLPRNLMVQATQRMSVELEIWGFLMKSCLMEIPRYRRSLAWVLLEGIIPWGLKCRLRTI